MPAGVSLGDQLHDVQFAAGEATTPAAHMMAPASMRWLCKSTPRASQPVPALRRQSPTERTRPTVWRTPFACPAHTAPSTRQTRVCRQAREPVSICQPHCRPPTRRHGTPRHPRVPPTPGATRYRGQLSSANRSLFAPAVEPPPPGLFADATPTPSTVCARFDFPSKVLVTRVDLTQVRPVAGFSACVGLVHHG